MPDVKALTAEVVSAFVGNAHVGPGEIPALIETVYATLRGLNASDPSGQEAADKPPSPSQIRRSITPEAIISFIDGKPYRTMKRHLASYGLTPIAYREKFGLPANYPIVAPAYSMARSTLAKSLWSGKRTALQSRSPESGQVWTDPAMGAEPAADAIG